jgi:hypothetical protein
VLLSVLLLAVAALLVVAGVALWSIPAGLIVAGVLLGSLALYVDFDRKAGKP